MKNNVVQNVSQVLASNMVLLFAAAISGLVIPRYLDLEQYSAFKTFTLYASYVVVFQLGFTTGIYIKHGGKDLSTISNAQIKAELMFLLLLLTLPVTITLFIGLKMNDLAIIGMALMAYPVNVIAFYKLLYQASGSFGNFAKLNSLEPSLNLMSIVGIVFILKFYNANAFIFARLIVMHSIMIVLIYCKKDSLQGIIPEPIFSRTNFTDMRIGFIIMLGSLSCMLFYSLDRWFVKFFLSMNDFAYYSFAASMMSMVIILINSVSMTFYPMLVRKHEQSVLINRLKITLIILGSFSSATYFVFHVIINLVLESYIPSLGLIAILFAGLPAMAVINAIYLNLYKARKDEKRYFFTVFSMLIVSLLCNIVAVIVYKETCAIALATTMAFYFWFYYSSKDFNGTKPNLREIIYITTFLILFFLSTKVFPIWIGFPLYISSLTTTSFLIYPKEFKELLLKTFSLRFLRKKTES